MNMQLQPSQGEPHNAARPPRPNWISYATEQLRQSSRPAETDRPKASK